MSSVGPSIAIVTDQDKKTLEKVLKPLGLKIAIVTKVDNHGLQVVHTA
jgi:beta-ribofuranosylaminobenzene 5'-phosphate synthase